MWPHHDRAKCLMAVFTAYYDASGQQSDRGGALIVAGVVATVQKHEKFWTAWRKALIEAGVPHFHMKEFAHSRGAYADWKGKEIQRVAFLKRLIAVMKRHLNKSFSVWLPIAEFKEINTRVDFPDALKEPFSFCATRCRLNVEKWLAKRYPGHRLAHVFEAGDAGLGPFVEMTTRVWKVPVTVFPKVDPESGERLHQFEAADFLAWERHDFYGDVLAGERRRLRESFLAMHKHLPHDGRVFTKESLERICRENPEIYRPRT
jgi:hypothetical protein